MKAPAVSGLGSFFSLVATAMLTRIVISLAMILLGSGVKGLGYGLGALCCKGLCAGLVAF